MNRRRPPLPLLALLLAASLLLPALAAAYEHLLIVSIDALHPNALDAEVSPTLHGLMLEGRYTVDRGRADARRAIRHHPIRRDGGTASAFRPNRACELSKLSPEQSFPIQK